MIAELTGVVSSRTPKYLVLRVAGVGYLVQMTPADLDAVVIGEKNLVHTHLVIRESSHELFGFLALTSLRVFEKLITIPKIGPRSALAILSVADPALIIESVQQNNAEHLARMSGLSPARAERVVTGLRGKLDELGPTSAITANDQENETLEALRALGYTLNEARRALRATPSTEDTATRLRATLRFLTNDHG